MVSHIHISYHKILLLHEFLIPPGASHSNLSFSQLIHHRFDIGLGWFGQTLSYCHVKILLVRFGLPQLSVTTQAGIKIEVLHVPTDGVVMFQLYIICEIDENHHKVQFVMTISHDVNQFTGSLQVQVTLHIHQVLQEPDKSEVKVIVGGIVSTVNVVLVLSHRFQLSSSYCT
jgi:hypothetical protein